MKKKKLMKKLLFIVSKKIKSLPYLIQKFMFF